MQIVINSNADGTVTVSITFSDIECKNNAAKVEQNKQEAIYKQTALGIAGNACFSYAQSVDKSNDDIDVAKSIKIAEVVEQADAQKLAKPIGDISIAMANLPAKETEKIIEEP